MPIKVCEFFQVSMGSLQYIEEEFIYYLLPQCPLPSGSLQHSFPLTLRFDMIPFDIELGELRQGLLILFCCERC